MIFLTYPAILFDISLRSEIADRILFQPRNRLTFVRSIRSFSHSRNTIGDHIQPKNETEVAKRYLSARELRTSSRFFFFSFSLAFVLKQVATLVLSSRFDRCQFDYFKNSQSAAVKTDKNEANRGSYCNYLNIHYVDVWQ